MYDFLFISFLEIEKIHYQKLNKLGILIVLVTE